MSNEHAAPRMIPILMNSTRALALHTSDIKNAAMRLYERMGFHRAPELDFEPAPGVTAKGYLLTVEETDL
jgi:hypothetical protein